MKTFHSSGSGESGVPRTSPWPDATIRIARRRQIHRNVTVRASRSATHATDPQARVPVTWLGPVELQTSCRMKHLHQSKAESSDFRLQAKQHGG